MRVATILFYICLELRQMLFGSYIQAKNYLLAPSMPKHAEALPSPVYN